jgi:hypothetical protein
MSSPEQSGNQLPRYAVTQHPDGFFRSIQEGRHILSTLVRVSPPVGEPDNFYAVVGSKLRPNVALTPGVTNPGDKSHPAASQFEIKTIGHDEAAKARLARAVGGVVAYFNQWGDPQTYLNYTFTESRHEPADPTDIPRTGKQYIPYETFLENPDDYFARLGQPEEDVEVIMKYVDDLTPEERRQYGIVGDPDPENLHSLPHYVGTPSDNADEGYGHGGDSD